MPAFDRSNHRYQQRPTFLAEAARGAEAFAGHSFIPLWKCWPADLETPLTTWLKVGAGGRYGVLLESVEGGERLGRWSVVVTDPLWTLTCRGGKALRQWRDGSQEELEGNLPAVAVQGGRQRCRDGGLLPLRGHQVHHR